MTSPHRLRWDALSWNFEVEHADGILGHNVEYRHSMSGLTILVLLCSKRDQLEGAARQRGWKLGFFKGETLMKLRDSFTRQVIQRHVLPCPSSGPRVGRFCEGRKKETRRDMVTIPLVNKMHQRQSGKPHPLATSEDGIRVCKAVDCILSLLLRPALWTAMFATTDDDGDLICKALELHSLATARVCSPGRTQQWRENTVQSFADPIGFRSLVGVLSPRPDRFNKRHFFSLFEGS